MRFYLYLFLFLSLSSCLSLEKAVDKVTANETNARVASLAIKEKHPIVSASLHAVWYPVVPKTTVVIDTLREVVTVPGDSIDCPTVPNPGNVGNVPAKPVKVKCPDVTYYTTTIKEYTTTIEENTAALHEKELELMQKDKQIFDTEEKLKQAEADRDKWKDKNEKKFWALVGIGVFFVLFVVFKVLAARVRVLP